MRAGIDVVRHVWGEEYDPLMVAPSADCPGYVRIYAEGAEAVEFWGRVDFAIPKEMALKLAEAIKACAEEQE